MFRALILTTLFLAGCQSRGTAKEECLRLTRSRCEKLAECGAQLADGGVDGCIAQSEKSPSTCRLYESTRCASIADQFGDCSDRVAAESCSQVCKVDDAGFRFCLTDICVINSTPCEQ